MTKIESYMTALLSSGVSAHSGFLGAYNMGLWGVSVSGKAELTPGLLASGTLLRTKPQFNGGGNAQNYVKFYDTPNLWGFGDSEVRECPKCGAKVPATSRATGCPDCGVGTLPDAAPWSAIATTAAIQGEMDKKRAWTQLVNRWEAVIGQSKFLVDITSLSPPFDGHIAQLGICNGIAECLNQWILTAKKNPKKAPRLMIRLLFGMTITNLPGFSGANTNWEGFKAKLRTTLSAFVPKLSALASKVPALPEILYGSDMGRKPVAFNHSKIVAGDGQYAVVGGHNMCEEVSSNTSPVVHDITSEVTGPGAKSANVFAGSLWLKAAESGRLYIYQFDWTKRDFTDRTRDSSKRWAPKNWSSYSLGKQQDVPGVLTNQYWYYPMGDLPDRREVDPPSGSVPATAIMGVGRWGETKVFSVDGGKGLKNNTPITPNLACQFASDVVKRLMINDPKTTHIAMAQQDLINDGLFGAALSSEHTICDVLGKKLRTMPKGLAIRVVVSTRFSQNSEGLAYSYGDGPREGAERISDSTVRRPHKGSKVNALPPRLSVLGLSQAVGSAEVHQINASTDPSFCTIAPLAFCAARGVTRDRGSYVWPDANYVYERLYTSGRFYDKKTDGVELKFGPGNHSKVMFVCEGENNSTGVVMIGSDNMYPSPLSEFNFVIEGQQAIELFRRQYWDKLWGYSARLGFTVASNGTVS